MIEFDNLFSEYSQAASARPSPLSPPDLPALPPNTVVTMAYVPFQQLKSIYCAQDGLQNGTMFPCLNKPFTGKVV